MSWVKYANTGLDLSKVKYKQGDIVRIINAPWGNAHMARYIGSVREIGKFYCWMGPKEYYLLNDNSGWIWCGDYFEPVEEIIEFEPDELMKLLKE